MHTHTARQANCGEAGYNVLHIVFSLATALCQQNLIISMQFLRQLLGGGGGWGASSLLGGFICSRVMAISQCVAPSNMPVPLWCVLDVCVCVCVCERERQ